MFRTRLIGVSLTLLSALVSVAAAKAVDVPTWTATGSIKTARYSAASALLGNGDALLIGGRLPYQPAPIISVERFNHTTGQWAYTGTTLSARNSAQAVTLRDGHVLLAGGESSPLNYYDTTELYDPGTGKWSPGPTMGSERSAFALTELGDGKVLAAGGWFPLDAEDAAEVLDPVIGTWTPTEPMHTVRANPSAVRLTDGRVLVAGGYTSPTSYLSPGDYNNSAEVYDPATNAWTEIASMHEGRMAAGVARLPDGRVLVAGGAAQPQSPDFLPVNSSTYEIYDPATDTWSAPKPLGRAGWVNLVTLTDGRPMLIVTTETGAFRQTTAQVYDAATDTWRMSTTPAAASRADAIAVALGDDSVLVASGLDAERSAERITMVQQPVVTPVPTATATPIATVIATPAATVSPTPVAAKPGVAKLVAPKQLKASALSLKVACTGETVCRGRLVLRVRGGRTLARANVVVQPGKSLTVRLKLSAADRRRLMRRATKVTLTLGTQKVNLTLRG